MSYEIVPGRPRRTGQTDGPGVNFDKQERPITGERLVPDVGAFRQTTPEEDWVLRRYLLTRALGTSIIRSLQWTGISILIIAALVWLAGVEWLAVLIGFVALIVLMFRATLSGIQRRISGIDRMGNARSGVEDLVGQTRKGLRAELRRIGLPSHPWGPLMIGMRLARPVKRRQTIAKLASFDLSQVVPASTLDELHLLLRKAR
ncbi:MAG TPA: hypothetical protein VGH11_12090 [Jatrophihabitans sp.]|jgi:hypothetical protein